MHIKTLLQGIETNFCHLVIQIEPEYLDLKHFQTNFARNSSFTDITYGITMISGRLVANYDYEKNNKRQIR